MMTLPGRNDLVPARWLLEHEHLLPREGDALDVACGFGRHALWLAARGLRTLAIDGDADAIRFVREESLRRGLPVTAVQMDLEAGLVKLAEDAYDVVVAVHYLHRPLFPLLKASLRQGGLLVYETFTRGQAERGRPRNRPSCSSPASCGSSSTRSRSLSSGKATSKESCWQALLRGGSDRLGDRFGGDAEVRRRPHDAPVPNHQRLGRFVPHAQPPADGVREVAVGLYGHHRVAHRARLGPIEMVHELVQGLGADAA